MKIMGEEIIKRLKEHRNYLSSEYGLKRIGIFGSYAKGTQSEESDIGIIAEFEKSIGLKFIDFSEFIENILGKRRIF